MRYGKERGYASQQVLHWWHVHLEVLVFAKAAQSIRRVSSSLSQDSIVDSKAISAQSRTAVQEAARNISLGMAAE